MYKTGNKAPFNGTFQFVSYTDGTNYPSPTPEERLIKLTSGERFPPIHSVNKGAWWVKV